MISPSLTRRGVQGCTPYVLRAPCRSVSWANLDERGNIYGKLSVNRDGFDEQLVSVDRVPSAVMSDDNVAEKGTEYASTCSSICKVGIACPSDVVFRVRRFTTEVAANVA
jgi:hypothetical protein